MIRPRAVAAVAVSLAAALAACGDDPPHAAPAPPVRAGTPTASEHTPRARADVPTPARPDAKLIDGDRGGWTPSPEDAALAARLGDLDPVAAEAAESEIDDLPEERQIAVLRAGLRLADPTAARRAAIRCKAAFLDGWEQARASSLFIDAVLDPSFTRADGEDRPMASDLYEVGGSSSDLSILFRRFAEHPVDPAVLGPMASGLHKLFRQGHGTEIAALLAACDEETIDEAWTTVAYGLSSGAVADADAAAALSARFGDLAPGGVPNPATDPVGAAVTAMLHREIGWVKNVGDDWIVAWASRLVDRTDPALLVARSDDVRRAAAAAAGRPQFIDRVVARLARAETPEAAALARELVAMDGHAGTEARLAALARLGDLDALAAVVERLFADGEMLAEALLAVPTLAHPEVERAVLGPDDALAAEALEAIASAMDEYLAHRFDRAWFVSLGERATAAGASPERLASIARQVQATRTASFARTLLAKETFAAAPSLLDDDGVLAWLEVIDAAALRARLREAWDAGRTGAIDWLLRLGDPERASRLVHHVKSLTERDRATEARMWLARTRSPEVRTYLLEVAGADDAREFADGVTALAAFAGLDEAAARGFRRVLEPNEVSAEARDAMRSAVAGGRPVDALVRALAEFPDAQFDDVSLAGAHPEIVAYLERLRVRRESGNYAWATAELARLGYDAQRAETFRAIEDRRYRWTDELSWRHWMAWVESLDGVPHSRDRFTSGAGFRAIAEIAGENCCSRVHVSMFFDGAFGFDSNGAGPDPRVNGRDRALHFAPPGSEFAWSRIAGCFVRVQE